MPVTFLWDNLGPMHVDRIQAVIDGLDSSYDVAAVEVFGRSETYAWDQPDKPFPTRTLFKAGEKPSFFQRFSALASAFRKRGRGHYFLCHYDWTEVALIAACLRLTGSRVTTMGCSKFDDLPRSASREFLKSVYLKPYSGAIGSGKRSRDYFRFLGIPENRISTEYNTVSVDRFRTNSGVVAAPAIETFANRHWTCVARFVHKKNLFVLLDAYAKYRSISTEPRELHLCGSGPLEAELRNHAEKLGIADDVKFRGFLQTDAIAKVLSNSIGLLLPSIEEQFGNVVIEAQAVGLPVILSENCGARDRLVQSGRNGFVVEPDNPEGISFFMNLLDSDAMLWHGMSKAAYDNADRGDVGRFVEAVRNQLAN